MSEIDLLIQELRDTIDNQREEIDRLNNINKQLVEECQRLDDEETRLNNIIDELEKFLENEINLNNLDSYTLQKTREYLNFKCYELRRNK